MWFILASHGVYWLLIDRRQFKQVFMSYLFIFLAQLPWIPTLFSQVKTVAGDYWIGGMNSRTHAEYFMRITAGDIVTPWQIMLSKVMFAALLISPILVYLKNKPRTQYLVNLFLKKLLTIWFSLMFIFSVVFLLIPERCRYFQCIKPFANGKFNLT
jgi:hypothetical protein